MKKTDISAVPSSGASAGASGASSGSSASGTGSAVVGAAVVASGSSENAGSFNVSGTGDPHLSATINGRQSSATNSDSESDLIDGNSSFDGGDQVATTANHESSHGAAFNHSADTQMGVSTWP